MPEKKGGSSEKVLYCSFCGKSQHEVKKLIAGPSVFICDECIELCNDIIRDEVPADSPAALEWMTERAEILLRRLGLAYRVLLMSTREMGFVQAKNWFQDLSPVSMQ